VTKITTEHLARSARLYIRQSTADQLAHNHESRRRHYGLVDRAKQLGWSNVDVIDDDLGRSGGGIARPGFERLLATICDGRVGAVLAIEASRLARNGRDWYTPIEFVDWSARSSSTRTESKILAIAGRCRCATIARS
jgi:DNA invertase Pin-like site-specific DNA recombinase